MSRIWPFCVIVFFIVGQLLRMKFLKCCFICDKDFFGADIRALEFCDTC